MSKCKKAVVPVLVLFMVLCLAPVSFGTGLITDQTRALNPLETNEPFTIDSSQSVVVEPDLYLKQNAIDIDVKDVQNIELPGVLDNSRNNQRLLRTTGYNPLNAPQIQLDQDVPGYLTAQGQQHLYYLQVPANGKITEIMSVPSGLDYDIALYRINPPGQGYTGITSSNYPSSLQNEFLREQVSAIVNAGDYYVLIQAISGSSTTNPYHLRVVESTSYSSYEPNDNLNTPSNVNVPVQPDVNIAENIDNAYDYDFFRLSVAETSQYRMDFLHTAGGGANHFKIYSLSGNTLSLVAQANEGDSGFINLNNGTYYIWAYPTTYSSGSSYQILLRKRISSTQITQIMGWISAPPYFYSGARTDTFGGSKFVVDGRSRGGVPGDLTSVNDVQVRGVATDAQGRPVPNAYIQIQFNSTNQNHPRVYGGGYTDSYGNYSINMLIPSSYWTDRLPSGAYVFRYSDANFIAQDADLNWSNAEYVIHMFDTNLDYEP